MKCHTQDQCEPESKHSPYDVLVDCDCTLTWFAERCSIQSGEPVEVPVATEQMEIATFSDLDNTMSSETNAPTLRGALADKVDVGELSDFLARPVRISNISWLESDTVGTKTTVKPWVEYLNSPAVKKKLDNFAWLRADLHIKVVVTASPFYYGLMMVSYKPLQTFIPSDNFVSTYAFVPRSQRPHIMVYPADSLGGEKVLPFIYPANYVDVQDYNKIADLGELTYDVVSELTSANGVTGQAVSVQTYAWLENVELQGPSIGLALQSKEIATGPVSSVASSVARFANKLTTLPFVGKFMKATEIGSSAIGAIASLFGFTNLPVLEPARPIRSMPFPPLASTGVGYPVEKLTGDPHTELAVDGAPCNLDLEDELQITSLVQRSSYLDKATWSTSTAVDAQLFRANVTPHVFRRNTTATQTGWYYTPMGWISRVFGCWRGSIVYRFDFIKSKYHRGRVLITWDPRAQSGNNVSQVANVMGRTITKVVDLGAESSVEIEVPYAQEYPWLDVDAGMSLNYTVNGSDSDPAFATGRHNGVLVMRVLNVLTAPVASSSIDVVVTVRGGSDLEFNNPLGAPDWFSPFEVQSREVFETEADSEVMGSKSNPAPERYLINMGESYKSVRELLRRTELNETWEEPSNTTDQLMLIKHFQKRFPPAYGYDPSGLWTAKGIAAPASTFPFNYVHNTYFNWFAPSFVGVRGSMFWTYNTTNQSAGTQTPHGIRVTRTYDVANATRTRATQAVKTGANDAYFWWTQTNRTGIGAALTNTQTQSGLSVSIPSYTTSLFCSTRPDQATSASGGYMPLARDKDGALLSIVMHPAQGQTTRGLTIEKYCGAGTDLSLIYFVNVPVWYSYSTAPTPP